MRTSAGGSQLPICCINLTAKLVHQVSLSVPRDETPLLQLCPRPWLLHQKIIVPGTVEQQRHIGSSWVVLQSVLRNQRQPRRALQQTE